jgi:esterase/lipase
MFRIESLLSARLFLAPQLANNRIYFISNLSGRMSLYAMNYGGSVPEPLLPPNIALQNPELVGGESYKVFPDLGKILLMLDQDGDEVYKPMLLPLDGGYPTPIFTDIFDNHRVYMGGAEPETNVVYLVAASLNESLYTAYRANLASNELTKIHVSVYGCFPDGHNANHQKIALVEGYATGDNVVYLWDEKSGNIKLIYGVPISDRTINQQVPLNSIHSLKFVHNDSGLIFHTTVYDDHGGLGYLDLNQPDKIQPVQITGVQHEGLGEFEEITHLHNQTYLVKYNIDGCAWVYEGQFDESQLSLNLKYGICGQGVLSNGVLEHIDFDKGSNRYVLSYSTATSPTQIYSVEGAQRNIVQRHTNERILGIPSALLSSGEDASYVSYDGTQISARLYFPADDLGYSGPRPLVYYIHGGPQSQEKPDFAWFSMPLIQFLTLNGFAVFVPNVRGSSGYGLKYTKEVDRDWGGKDRLDHVHAMTDVLPNDKRIDISRAGVVGRSYGGYMTLTLSFRHPELWSAAVDMFGPYDLFTFLERIPETWKPYFYISLGHPENDRDFLLERSPRTYMDQITAPLLVIQGKNDPRVVERESRDVVEHLRKIGKEVDYLMFENEGHDVLKYENRVACYNAITNFFIKHLRP